MVLANGSIFFTDSSRKFRRPDVLFDIIEGRGNGQLLHFDPGPRKTHVVLDGLPFPNGMCLSHDETALLIAETTRARIMRRVTIREGERERERERVRERESETEREREREIMNISSLR